MARQREGALRAALVTVLWVCSASAQDTKGRALLGLEGAVLGSESGEFEFDTDGTPSKLKVNFKASHTGLLAGTGIVVGGGVGDKVVFAGRVAHSSQVLEQKASGLESEGRVSTFEILPRLELMLNQGKGRLFLFGTVGYRASVSNSSAEDDTLSSRSRLRYDGVSVGAGLGLHGFVGERVSLDPSVSLLHTSGDLHSESLEGKFTSNVILLSVGISAWLGGAPAAPPASTPSIAPAKPPPADVDQGMPEPSRTVVRPSGVVSKVTAMHDRSELRLLGHPAKDGGTVFIHLALRGNVPSPLSSWKECGRANIRAEDQLLPIPNLEIEQGGFGGSSALRARVPVSHMIRLLRAERIAAIEVCSQQIDLGPEGRRALLQFLKVFKELAEDAGTWERAPLDSASVGAARERTPHDESDRGASGTADTEGGESPVPEVGTTPEVEGGDAAEP